MMNLAIVSHPRPSTLLERVLPVAGISYVSAWIVGLAVNPAGPALDAERHVVVAHYANHAGQAAAQSLLVHGVAAAALGFVVLTVTRRAEGRDLLLARAAGMTAVGLSVLQMVLGLLAAGDSSAAPARLEALSRIDGLKMLALAVFVAATLTMVRRRLLPRWLGGVGGVLVVALVPAAIGYLTMSTTLAIAAAPALLLLLVFVAGAAFSSRQG
jgi:hypothetical protein